MQLHHYLLLALVAVWIVAPKVGRAVSIRAWRADKARYDRRMAALRCAREVAQVEKRREYLDLTPRGDETPTVAVLRALREQLGRDYADEMRA